MSQIRWQRVFDTGIPKIDEQHKKLVGMINSLEQAHASGPDAADHEIGLVLRKLVEYTQYHFAEEERVMEQISFAERKYHAERHKELMHHVAGLFKKLKASGTVDVYELMSLLRDWFLDHIVLDDVKIGEAYRELQKSAEPTAPTT